MSEESDLYRVLVVEPDPLFREMVESAIKLHNPACAILTADHPEGAHTHLERGLMDVTITDIDFGEGPQKGVLFLELLLMRQIPEDVLVVSSHPFSACRGLVKAAQFLPKPPAMDELLRRVDRVLELHRDSILRGMTLPSVLQVIAQDSKTCTLTVTSGSRTGFFFCMEGRLIHAVNGEVEGKAAAMEILSWPNVTTRITDRCRATRSIYDSLTNILLDWALEKDHAAGVNA